MAKLDRHHAELLDTIVNQAQALRDGTVTSRAGAVALLASNVETLVAWEKLLEKEDG